MLSKEGVRIIVDRVSVKNPVVIEGFPGIGLVGTIATQHLIEQLEMKQIGIIASQEYFPPVVVTLGGIVNAPVRMYEQIDRKVIAIISDIPIHPNASNEVGDALIDWAISINAKEIISIAGLMTMSDEHRVYAVATSKELLERLKGKAEVLQTGAISGVSGSILNSCILKKFNAICLMGETYGPNPDPRAAAEVIKVLNSLFGWEVAVDKLIEQAEQIEFELHRLAEQVKTTGIEPKKEYPMYG
jgi:uncharacterized protein